jgi:osmotically-inducible protein OsmY
VPNGSATEEYLMTDEELELRVTARWQHQREEAEFVAGNILGVTGVDGAIDLVDPGPAADNVRDSIKGALDRRARLEADNIGADVANRTATLTGDVRSVWERGAVVAAAWAAMTVPPLSCPPGPRCARCSRS